jgi:hypothetical protein
MKLYLTSWQMPELTSLPADVRCEIVDAAINSIPITSRNSGLVGGYLATLAALGSRLTEFVGHGTVFFWLPLGVVGLNVLLLNMARPHIAELLRTLPTSEPEGERTS